MVCTASSDNKASLRAEGFTERTSDIVIVCSGGSAFTSEGSIPTANISVFFGTNVTNRTGFLGLSNVSDAMLLIDEPGANVGTFGSSQPQVLCQTPTTGCSESADVTNGSNTLAPGAPNVFLGVPSGNIMTFNGVPILAPGASGVRIFRITGIRVNAAGIAPPPAGGPITVAAFLSVSGSTALPLISPNLSVGTVNASLTTQVQGNLNTFAQCQSTTADATGGGQIAGVLSYQGNFLNAFRTRTASGVAGPLDNGFTAQNVPGTLYYGSESGFIFPDATAPTQGPTGFGSPLVRETPHVRAPINTIFAGLTDYGTRFKAVFNNIPSGVTVLDSTDNIASTTSAATTASSSYAVLVNGETAGDSGGSAPTVASSATLNGVPVVALTAVNGVATATWEVLKTANNVSVNENFQFLVTLAYSGNSAGLGTIGVSQSFAPTATNGAFTVGAAGLASSSLPVPRFADLSSAAPLATIMGCASLTLNAPGVVYGNAASVTASAGSIATGSISLSVNSGAAVTQTLAAGAATFNLGKLAAASYNLSAVYNPGNLVSASTTGTLVVSKAPLTVTATASKVYGAPVPSFTAVFSGFVNGDTQAVVSGTPTLTTTATAASAAGSYPITAGAGTLTASNYSFTPSNGVLTIAKASTTTTITTSGAQLTAVVSPVAPGAGTPTGTVQFLNGATVLATVTLAAGSASIATPSSGTVSAVYSGDTNFTSSTSSSLILNPSVAAITLTSSANPSLLGQSVTFTAAVTITGGPAGLQAGGSVQFFDGAKSLGSASLSNGQAAVSSSTLTFGSHSITAQYSGDGAFPLAQAVLGQTVNAPISITASAGTPAIFGQPVALTAKITTGTVPANYPAPTGQVTFSLEGSSPFAPLTTLATAALTSGASTVNVSTLTAGSHYLQAKYSGDSNWPSVATEFLVVVGPAATSTSVSLTLVSGQLTLTSTVVPQGAASGTPTGAIQFVDSLTQNVIATGNLAGGAVAVSAPSTAMARPIEAFYAGDANFAASNSAPLPAVVSAANLLPDFAPDEIASMFGATGLPAPPTSLRPLGAKASAVSIQVTDSAGTQRPADVYGVFSTQINFMIPAGTAPGAALLSIALPSGSVTTVIPISASAPSLFTTGMNGQPPYAGQIVYAHADGTQTTADASAALAAPASGMQMYLTLYGTGFRHATALSVTVNGIAVPVAWFGAQSAYPGLDQLNLGPLPQSLAGSPISAIAIE